MSEEIDVAGIVAEWAGTEPSVKALILIGSRVRSTSDLVWKADAQSDWDFHVISSRPRMFYDSTWTRELKGLDLVAYIARTSRIGGVPKVNAVFRGSEADFVILPAGKFSLLRFAARFGFHLRANSIRQRLQELALVVRPGWRFLKGASDWEPLYRRAVSDIPDPRLGDEELRLLADGFVCDQVSILRKIERGELSAAQRLIHRDLAETNFRLLHELRLRRGQRSFPEARRVERVLCEGDLMAITIDARLDAASLTAAVQKSAKSCRELMGDLVGGRWHWPNL